MKRAIMKVFNVQLLPPEEEEMEKENRKKTVRQKICVFVLMIIKCNQFFG